MSLAHGHESVCAMLSTDARCRVGCDLEPVGQLPRSFWDCWFLPQERAWAFATENAEATTIVWALKEALYKALGDGESFRPRCWNGIDVLSAAGIRLPDSRELFRETRFHAESSKAAVEIQRTGDTVAVMVSFW
jgi:phosphopantetheinyl transferase (holo-ACP synthase)